MSLTDAVLRSLWNTFSLTHVQCRLHGIHPVNPVSHFFLFSPSTLDYKTILLIRTYVVHSENKKVTKNSDEEVGKFVPYEDTYIIPFKYVLLHLPIDFRRLTTDSDFLVFHYLLGGSYRATRIACG